MGSELIRVTGQRGHNLSMLNLSSPETVLAIHRAYAASGAQVILTNTFQSNTRTIADQAVLWRIGKAAVELARKAGAKFVLADIGPIMSGTVEFECPEDLLQTIDTIPGVDGILIETCSSANVLLVIERLRHRIHSVVLVSFAFRHTSEGICSYDRHTPEWFAERAREAGVDVLGANCGLKISLADCIEIIARFRAKCDLPLLARPNAGTCRESENGFDYPISPAEFAGLARGLIESGAAMVGGCCGTTPKHIAAVRSELIRLNKIEN